MTNFENQLRDDLHAAADGVEIHVDPDAVAAAHARAARRSAIGWGALAALVAAVVVGWVATAWNPPTDRAVPDPLQTPVDTASPAPSPTPSTPTPATTSAPTATPGADATTPALVYAVVDTEIGPRLVRETRWVPAATPARGALEAMLAGPLDPDHHSAWPRNTRVLGIADHGDEITVDLSAEALRADVGAEAESLMVQQLVWTVTEALNPDARVLLRVDGAVPSWGHQEWSEPVARADADAVRLFVGIDTPSEGDAVDSPVTVRGEAWVFEANLLYTVTDAAGAVVADGYATTQDGTTFAPYAFDLDLTPGTYTVTVREDDASDGEGRAPFSESRTFRVR
ncbi:Gmad2 immunoglobulin-like domain-containing protein [Propioniciclava soli]|uniref:Gmad2 immunoglobulin-like domain-containing protein n=1 Tax=Propioniciclava soli TaxID=2775081 RepID=UPI001E2A13CC|nr:Gmad2 immunoglobulin-like domain-containing protein [Propioniciclava soli]